MKEKTDNLRKSNILVSWQEQSDKIVNRLIVLMLFVTVLYIYYGFLIPIISNNRLEQIKIANEDLVDITSQFEVLSSIYGRMTAIPPSVATQDMRIFQDQIIPVIYAKLNSKTINASGEISPQDSMIEREQILFTLEKDMQTLTELYNIHLNRHPQEIPTMKHLQNDPIYELDLLLRLDKVIQNLQRLAAKNEDVELCELAREIFSGRSEREIVRLGNSLTDTFKPYKDFFGKYTTITTKLKFVPEKGLMSYQALKDLIAPPFEVKTIDDLSKLYTLAQVTYEKNLNELEQNIEIPIIKASYDRSILMFLVPLIILLLLHIINSYFARSYRLLNKTTKGDLIAFSKIDFIHYGPYFYLALRGRLEIETTTWLQILAGRLRAIFAVVIKVAVIIAPTSVCIVHFIYVFNHPIGFFSRPIAVSFGILIFIFIINESYLLYKQWSNLFTIKEKPL